MGHLGAGSEGVSSVLVAGSNRPGGGKETGGGVNNDIRDGGEVGVRREIKQGIGRRGEVSGSERVKWSGMERGVGRMIDQPR